MAKFKYYQDQKVTMWQRMYFKIEADTKEEADKIVKENSSDDVENWSDIDDVADLTDTIEYLSPDDNQEQSTIETFDNKGVCLGGNGERLKDYGSRR